MAAGPGIRPRSDGAPWRSGRSAHNYPHLVAERAGLQLTDVTYSGATTAHILTDRQHGAPPQLTALDGSVALVTVTIGGNDVGYVPLLMAASLPSFARGLPLIGGRIAELLDRDARNVALGRVFDSLCEVGRSIRRGPRRHGCCSSTTSRCYRPRVSRHRRCPASTPTWAGTWRSHSSN